MKDSLFVKLARLLPDKPYLSLKFYKEFRRFPNWKNPQTFNEKLQWLKLYNRRPEYTMMVDKYAVKEWVDSKIGSEYVIPTLGVWDRPEDIEWKNLPNQFVLKTTHGGGNEGVVICRDKTMFDEQTAIDRLKRSLKIDLYTVWREWPYKDVPKRVIAEKFIEPQSGSGDLTDYKWYCFNGEPQYCQVIQNRTKVETIDFFDKNWLHQDFVGLTLAVKNAPVPPACPRNLDIQMWIARELSREIPFSRIDLYEVGEQTYFGEITLFPNSGMGRFRPAEWNYKIGDMLILPEGIK